MAAKKPSKSAPKSKVASLTSLASKLAVRTGAPKDPLVAAMARRASSAAPTSSSRAVAQVKTAPSSSVARTGSVAGLSFAAAQARTKITTALAKTPVKVSSVVARVSPVVAKAPTPVAKAPAPVAKAPAPVAKAPAPVAKAPAPVAKVPATTNGFNAELKKANESFASSRDRVREIEANALKKLTPARPVAGLKTEAAMPRQSTASTVTSRSSVAPRTQPVGDPRRKYPRAPVAVRASLKLADDPGRFFEASLETSNVSVGGLFLESSYFLKLGTKLDVTLDLGAEKRPVHVRASVVRVETPASGEGPGGFALRFTEYLDGSEVVLATHFLAPRLTDFLSSYAQKHGLDVSDKMRTQMVEVLAAWELQQAETGLDVWSE